MERTDHMNSRFMKAGKKKIRSFFLLLVLLIFGLMPLSGCGDQQKEWTPEALLEVGRKTFYDAKIVDADGRMKAEFVQTGTNGDVPRSLAVNYTTHLDADGELVNIQSDITAGYLDVTVNGVSNAYLVSDKGNAGMYLYQYNTGEESQASWVYGETDMHPERQLEYLNIFEELDPENFHQTSDEAENAGEEMDKKVEKASSYDIQLSGSVAGDKVKEMLLYGISPEDPLRKMDFSSREFHAELNFHVKKGKTFSKTEIRPTLVELEMTPAKNEAEESTTESKAESTEKLTEGSITEPKAESTEELQAEGIEEKAEAESKAGARTEGKSTEKEEPVPESNSRLGHLSAEISFDSFDSDQPVELPKEAIQANKANKEERTDKENKAEIKNQSDKGNKPDTENRGKKVQQEGTAGSLDGQYGSLYFAQRAETGVPSGNAGAAGGTRSGNENSIRNGAKNPDQGRKGSTDPGNTGNSKGRKNLKKTPASNDPNGNKGNNKNQQNDPAVPRESQVIENQPTSDYVMSTFMSLTLSGLDIKLGETKVQDMMDEGLQLDDEDAEARLNPGEQSSIYFEMGEDYLEAEVMNQENQEETLPECTLTGIRIHFYDHTAEVKFSNELTEEDYYGTYLLLLGQPTRSVTRGDVAECLWHDAGGLYHLEADFSLDNYLMEDVYVSVGEGK